MMITPWRIGTFYECCSMCKEKYDGDNTHFISIWGIDRYTHNFAWAMFCKICWPKISIAQRLAAYHEWRNPEFPWHLIAEAIWEDRVCCVYAD